MMSSECESWAEYLFEPEEALKEAERAGLQRHLAVCECCAIERELFLESWGALDGVEEELEPCPMLRARVWQKIREEERCPKPLLPVDLVSSGQGRSWRGFALKSAAAAAAIMLGFGVGRVLRAPEQTNSAALASAATQTEDFLDPALIELASQEGYSMELFPESTQFTAIDREMLTALAPSKDSRAWLSVDRGEVIPLQYISQGLPQPQRGRK